jgi:plastocyanin domain-containing protein
MNLSCLICEHLGLILLLAAIALGLLWYYFYHKPGKQPEHGPSVEIKVENGFHPSVITIEKGKTTRFNIIRTDPNPCLEEIVISDFKIRRHLPLNHKVGFEITPQHPGEYTFSCANNEHHGRIIVK